MLQCCKVPTCPAEEYCRKLVACTVTMYAAAGCRAAWARVKLHWELLLGSCASSSGDCSWALVRRKVKVSGLPPEPKDWQASTVTGSHAPTCKIARPFEGPRTKPPTVSRRAVFVGNKFQVATHVYISPEGWPHFSALP